jgi:hypothetical protein
MGLPFDVKLDETFSSEIKTLGSVVEALTTNSLPMSKPAAAAVVELSPFSNGSGVSGSFSLFLEPILNPYYKTYQNIITLNAMPPGPLEQMVVQIDLPALSPQMRSAAYSSPCYGGLGCTCAHVLLRYPKSVIGGVGSGAFKNADNFMGADDIPAVFSYLQNSGYKVDTSLTKMMFQSRVLVGGVSEKRLSGDRKLIAFVSFLLGTPM